MYGVNGEMLSKREAEVMKIIYALCHEKGVCLLSPAELLAQFSPKRGYTEETLEKILGELALDDYFELLSSERKGEKMYVISLRANGYAFERGYMQMRREGYRKICWTVLSAVLAFLVGVILKRIF